ncbi:MAG: acetolactate synthase small subunit [Burkholderiaceae bacterium]
MNTLNANDAAEKSGAVLEIDVANHPGVMSHVVSLFSRRACNVDGILCLPVGDGRHSRIWLRVKEDLRLPQMIRQVEKLEDVTAVRRHHAGHAVFGRLEEFFRSERSAWP